MPESKALTKTKRKWLIPLLIIIAGVFAAGLIAAGIYFIIPKPLTLKPGEMIRGKITLEAPKPYYVGDLIPVTLTIESRKGVVYQMPNLNNADIGPLEIKERSNPQTIRLRGGQLQKVSFLVTGWQAGKYTIPAISVEYKDPAGQTGTIKLSSRKLQIESLLPKNKTVAELLKLDVKGLKGPVGLPPRLVILWWSLAGIGLVILGWFLYRLYHKHLVKETGDVTGLTPPEPAHVIALRRLETIRAADYLSRKDFKTYYSELSECAREYLENRFQIRALEMTTEEFLVYVSSNRFLKLEYEMILKEFLKFSDLVKFAKHMPLVEEADRSFEFIRHFIETTKNVPEVDTVAAGVTTVETAVNNSEKLTTATKDAMMPNTMPPSQSDDGGPKT